MAEGERQYVVFKFLLRDGTAKPYAVCGSDSTTELKRGEELRTRRVPSGAASRYSCSGIQRDRKCIAKYTEAQR